MSGLTAQISPICTVGDPPDFLWAAVQIGGYMRCCNPLVNHAVISL